MTKMKHAWFPVTHELHGVTETDSSYCIFLLKNFSFNLFYRKLMEEGKVYVSYIYIYIYIYSNSDALRTSTYLHICTFICKERQWQRAGKKFDKATWAKENAAFKQHSAYLYRSRTGTELILDTFSTLLWNQNSHLRRPFVMFALLIK